MRRHLPFCEFPWVLVALVTGVVGCGRGLLEDPGAVSTPESPRAAGADGGVTAPTGRDAPAGAGAADAAAPDGASAPDAPGEVAPRPAALTAVFDATLRAPACRTVGASCDSGGLIEGRAGLGPEKNGPNTIYGACADGTRGQYGVDRSIEHLRVSTEDGSLLAPGKTARLELTVTACNCDDSLPDVLGLYLARDATDPSWIPLNVLTAGPLPGRQMLTATFTVPSGKLEAVRATITKGPFPPVCDALGGTTNPGTAESDDLVFAVDHDGPDFVYLWPEAETAVLTTPLVVNSGSFSSGDAFVQVPAGRNSLAAPPADGHAVLSFSVPAARSYRLWGRALAQSTSENSFWVRIGQCPIKLA